MVVRLLPLLLVLLVLVLLQETWEGQGFLFQVGKAKSGQFGGIMVLAVGVQDRVAVVIAVTITVALVDADVVGVVAVDAIAV